MHTATATHSQARTHTHANTPTQAHARTCTHTCTRTHTETHTHICAHTHTSNHILELSRYRYILMHTATATHGQVCAHTHAHTHTSARTQAHTHTQANAPWGPACLVSFSLDPHWSLLESGSSLERPQPCSKQTPLVPPASGSLSVPLPLSHSPSVNTW